MALDWITLDLPSSEAVPNTARHCKMYRPTPSVISLTILIHKKKLLFGKILHTCTTCTRSSCFYMNLFLQEENFLDEDLRFSRREAHCKMNKPWGYASLTPSHGANLFVAPCLERNIRITP